LLYSFDGYALDPDRRELRCGVTPIAMEPRCFDLLVHLIRHREHVVSRDDMIGSVWGGRVVSESTLNSRINAVRSAIGDSGAEQRLIKTLPRKGVRFVGEVREQQPPEPAAVMNGTALPQEAATQETVAVDGYSEAPAFVVTAPPRVFDRRTAARTVAVIGAFLLGILFWSYFAHAERSRANIETAAKLTEVFNTINMISREDYETVRDLQRWAVDLDPNNAIALANLTIALATGVLNQWSSDPVADLHTADVLLQKARRIAPEKLIVGGAECQILRAMRQFESAIKVCSEVAQKTPTYAFLHKEVGYSKMMLGQLDDALAEFREADRLEPNSRLRWTWQQGMGLVYLMQGQDEKAIDWLSRAALEAPSAGRPVAYLAAAYALVGRNQEAHEALDHHIKLWPTTTLSTFEPSIGTAAFNDRMRRVLEGLRLAGLPE
jgi:DNA-binding winged helix-turn-helix (wHTH) protein/tetratricopeptide (TPR) repeat protein